MQGGRGRKETEEGKKEVSVNGIAGMYRGGLARFGNGIVQPTGSFGCIRVGNRTHTHTKHLIVTLEDHGFKWFVVCNVLRRELPNKRGITSKIQLKKQAEPEEHR